MKKNGCFLGGKGKTVAHVEGMCVRVISVLAILYSSPYVNGGLRFSWLRVSDESNRVDRMI